MEAQITEHGMLKVKRKGKFQRQDCPYQPDIMCGDWCPLFIEERIIYVTLRCGAGMPTYEIVKDERKEEVDGEQ